MMREVTISASEKRGLRKKERVREDSSPTTVENARREKGEEEGGIQKENEDTSQYKGVVRRLKNKEGRRGLCCWIVFFSLFF